MIEVEIEIGIGVEIGKKLERRSKRELYMREHIRDERVMLM